MMDTMTHQPTTLLEPEQSLADTPAAADAAAELPPADAADDAAAELPPAAEEAHSLPEEPADALPDEPADAQPEPPLHEDEPEDEAPAVPQRAEEPPPAPAEQAPAEPEPPAAAEAADAAAAGRKRAYWRAILTGDPSTVPAEVRQRTGADEWNLPEEQREYRMLRTLNRSWVVDHSSDTREQVHARWKQRRAELTRSFGVRDNEEELFLALSQQEEQEPIREMARDIAQRCYMAALDGMHPLTLETASRLFGQDKPGKSAKLAEEAFRQGQAARERYKDLAARVTRGLEAFSALEEDAFFLPRMAGAVPDLVRAVDELAELDEPEFYTVLYLAAGMAQDKKVESDVPNLVTRMMQASRRGVANMNFGMYRVLSQLGVSSLHLYSSAAGVGGAEELANAWDKRSQVFNKLRHFSQEELRPLVQAGKENEYSAYLLDAAQSVPSTVLSFCGAPGFAAVTLSSVSDAVAEARERAPQGRQELQFFAGLLGGALQTGIYTGINKVGGKLMERGISRFAQARGKGALYSIGALNLTAAGGMEEMLKQYTAGKLSHAGALGMQEMAARVNGVASNIDWESFGDNVTDIESNMHEAAALLPYLLLRSGQLGLQHFRSQRAVLGDGTMMERLGISAEKRAEVLAEPDVARRSELLYKALNESKVFESVDFSEYALRALRLLGIEDYRGFWDKKTAREFFKLPAPASSAKKKSAGIPWPEEIRAASHERTQQVRSLYEQWWRRAGFGSEPLPELPDQHAAGSEQAEASYRLSPHADYDSYAAGGFRQLEQLSYRHALAFHTMDTLVRNPMPAEELGKVVELDRRNLLVKVARTIVRSMAGEARDAVFKEEIFDYLPTSIRAFGGEAPDSLAESATPPHGKEENTILSRAAQELVKSRQELSAQQVLIGLCDTIEKMEEAIPCTQEYHQALVEGLTPVQAYGRLLAKGLGVSEELIMQGWENNGRKFDTPPIAFEPIARSASLKHYRQLTNYHPESEESDGVTYTRDQRPDGSYTGWYPAAEPAENDLVGHAHLFFLPKQAPIDLNRLAKINRPSQLPGPYRLRHKEGYCLHDDLSMDATEDLTRLWGSTATKLVPGINMAAYRHFLRGFADAGADDSVTPRIVQSEALNGSTVFDVDSTSSVSPLALMQTRFFVYWLRQLRSHVITPLRAHEFLQKQGYALGEDDVRVPNSQLASPLYRIPKRMSKSNPNEEVITSVAHALSEYTTVRYLAKMQELDVPESVKLWVGMSAFCPKPEIDPRGRGRNSPVVKLEEENRRLASWANRRTAEKLRSWSDAIEAARTKVRPDEFMDPILSDAFGENEDINCERGWCFRALGDQGLQNPQAGFWYMLAHPRAGWKRELLGDYHYNMLYDTVADYCEQDPYFSTLRRNKQGDISVDRVMGMLGDMLQKHPEMHAYSMAGAGGTSRLLRISLQDDVPAVPESAGSFARRGDRWETSPGCTYEPVLDELPEFLSRPHAKSYLGLLDELRQAAINYPRSTQEGVLWNGDAYGGLHGKTPPGLERNYSIELPISPLLRVLQSVGAAEGGKLNVCGVRVRGISPDLDLSPLINSVTVYRYNKDRSHVYRLMPGNINLSDPNLRLPYVVQCRNGMYMDSYEVIKNDQELGANSVAPLHLFYRSRERDNYRQGGEWADLALRHNLTQINRIATSALESGLTDYHTTYMQEYLMRLAEDSGFSKSLEQAEPGSLTMGEASLVNMLSDMVHVVCAPKPRAELRRLVDTTARMLDKDAKMRPLYSLLTYSNDKLAGNRKLHLRPSTLQEEWKAPAKKAARAEQEEPEAVETQGKAQPRKQAWENHLDQVIDETRRSFDQPDPEEEAKRLAEEEKRKSESAKRAERRRREAIRAAEEEERRKNPKAKRPFDPLATPFRIKKAEFEDPMPRIRELQAAEEAARQAIEEKRRQSRIRKYGERSENARQRRLKAQEEAEEKDKE